MKTPYCETGVKSTKMADTDLSVGQRKRALLLRRILAERRRRMLTQRVALSYHEARWKRIRVLLLILCILLNSRNSNRIITRSCRRVSRNTGWWLNVWNTYSDARFKKLFRVSKGTFLFILGQIRHDLVRYSLRGANFSRMSSCYLPLPFS